MWLCRRGLNICVVVLERVHHSCVYVIDGLAFMLLCRRGLIIYVVV